MRPKKTYLLPDGRIAMTGLTPNDERCEALFASALQRSDALNVEAIIQAIGQTVSALGRSGCASRMAQEFGDHPEAASERMQWARQVLSDMPASTPATTDAARVDCAA
jgi:hypothetical protein